MQLPAWAPRLQPQLTLLPHHSSLPTPPPSPQGYRVVSDRSWVVGRVSRDGNVIYSLIDPNAPADDEDDGEVPPLLALVDMMEAASLGGGSDNELTEGEL